MAHITMPQLGETVTEGTITKWLKTVGDSVAEDEALFEVSTDKVDSEVPSPTTGVLTEILVQEGETVDVGAKLAVISADGAAPSGVSAPAAEASPRARTDKLGEVPMKAERQKQAGTPEMELTTAPPAETKPVAQPQQPAPQAGPSPQVTQPPVGSVSDDDDDESGGGSGSTSKVLSPVVRRLISEHNLNPEGISGSGAGGRITHADVLALVERNGATPQPPATSSTAAARASQAAAADTPRPAAAHAPAMRGGERDEVVPFNRIRKVTAEHMVRSKAISAHTLVVIEVDYENVDRVRRAAKNRFRAEEGVGLTYLPFIARATVDAIRDFPRINSSVGDDELVVHHYVNLGIAVDLNYEGLLVPVVRDADGKRMRTIAREIADLANRARTKKLSADELAGGTFTITNAGGYGTLIIGPVINQPEIAILSTDGVKKKPVVIELPDGSDAIVVHPVGNLAMSWDHRAVDGAYAAAFIARIKEILETRDWAHEL